MVDWWSWRNGWRAAGGNSLSLVTSFDSQSRTRKEERLFIDAACFCLYVGFDFDQYLEPDGWVAERAEEGKEVDSDCGWVAPKDLTKVWMVSRSMWSMSSKSSWTWAVGAICMWEARQETGPMVPAVGELLLHGETTFRSFPWISWSSSGMKFAWMKLSFLVILLHFLVRTLASRRACDVLIQASLSLTVFHPLSEVESLRRNLAPDLRIASTIERAKNWRCWGFFISSYRSLWWKINRRNRRLPGWL